MLTPAGQAIDKASSGALSSCIKFSKKASKGSLKHPFALLLVVVFHLRTRAAEVGSGEVVFGIADGYPRVALVGLGKHPSEVKLSPEQEDYKEGE